ncbi:hypothetical protein [Streptomyces tendae]|uniref:hypothetical protein n=2 Tax=Streptomyces TaxID=1883 RepID=UPI00341625E8
MSERQVPRRVPVRDTVGWATGSVPATSRDRSTDCPRTDVSTGEREHRATGHKGYRTEVLTVEAGTDQPTDGRTGPSANLYAHASETRLRMGFEMIILGLILLIIGLLAGLGLLTTIGGVLILVGAILWILGATGRAVGGRKHFF